MDVDPYPQEEAQKIGTFIDQAYLNPDVICPSSDILTHNGADLDLELDVALKRKCQTQNNNLDNNNENSNDQNQNNNMQVDQPSQNECDDEGEWNEISLTDEEIDKIQQQQPEMPNKNQLSKAKHWLEYLEDPINPWESKYRCKICHGYSKLYHVFDYLIPEVGQPNGILKSTKQENTYYIKTHEKTSNVHQKLLEMRKKHKKLELVETEISGLITDRFTDEYSYAVTNRHIRLVMSSAKMGLSFRSYPLMV